jgi:hypothetical protein
MQNPDPHPDPDPQKINADPQPWLFRSFFFQKSFFLFVYWKTFLILKSTPMVVM